MQRVRVSKRSKLWEVTTMLNLDAPSNRFYTPSFYVPDYATAHLGLSASKGATAAALISGLSAAGRVVSSILFGAQRCY